MKSVKKIALLALSFVLVAALAVGTTLAFLQDSDGAVNVMTIGNVKIKQLEYERAVDADGNFISTGVVDEYTYTPDMLQPFTQDKPIYPAIYAGTFAPWSDRVGTDGTLHQQSWKQIGAPGSNQLVDAPNVIDKFVFVENTGISDAYFRTLVAIECPEGVSEDMIHIVSTGNSRFEHKEENNFCIVIDGVRYLVLEYLYTPVLQPGEISRPSLLQVYLDKAASNEICALFGETMEILALSQAVQVKGFKTAKEALDTAFGAVAESNANVALWFKSLKTATPSVPSTPSNTTVQVTGTDKTAVLSAIENAQPGDTVVFTSDVTIAGHDASKKLIIDKAITLDLGGNTITTECGWGGIDLKGGASIKNGTINHTGNTAAIKAFQVESIENVTINLTETAGKVKGGIVLQEGSNYYIGSIKNVTINGATNGIETYRCGERTDFAIGSMENVTINATDTGISLSAPIGEVKNCTIKGAKIGINAYLYGPYSVSITLVNSKVEGAVGIYVHDEVGKTNPGSLSVICDNDTVVIGGIKQEIEPEVAFRVTVKY